MDVEKLTKQIGMLQNRLDELYQNAKDSVELSPELLPLTFKELGTTSEELHVAAEEICTQAEEIAQLQLELEAQRQHYRNLYESLPDAYLITDARGKVQEANRATSALLALKPQFLRNKLLINFIPNPERREFRCRLDKFHQQRGMQRWTTRFQPRNATPIQVELRVTPVYASEGNLINLRWLVREIGKPSQLYLPQLSTHPDPYQNRPLHRYRKGEIISLQSQEIWLVCRGLVKLSTMNENGNEVLVGLAGPSMPFGANFTSLPTYQATALSEDVQLVCLPFEEVTASPYLCQTLFPKLNQRLRQTEFLLAISGKRQVKDRLYYLLQWLKREFGQPIAKGTRLGIRLTHQDLADACCTTRVTITRELGKLQQQRKIALDPKNHLILTE